MVSSTCRGAVAVRPTGRTVVFDTDAWDGRSVDESDAAV